MSYLQFFQHLCDSLFGSVKRSHVVNQIDCRITAPTNYVVSAADFPKQHISAQFATWAKHLNLNSVKVRYLYLNGQLEHMRSIPRCSKRTYQCNDFAKA